MVHTLAHKQNNSSCLSHWESLKLRLLGLSLIVQRSTTCLVHVPDIGKQQQSANKKNGIFLLHDCVQERVP